MISLILVIIAGVAKAFMDLSADGKLPQNLDKANTWKNKWKNGYKDQGEKFPGSSTVFVAFTDFWHLMQLIFLNFLMAAIILYKPMVNPLVDFIILSVCLKVTFELIYRRF